MAIVFGICCGCSAAGNHAYPRSFGIGAAPPPPANSDTAVRPAEAQGVTGIWEGMSSADCMIATLDNDSRCHAEQKIKLTMMQQGSAVSGFYQCAYGNQVCR
ncbi:MAG: hypothetical protein ACREQT_08135, partial [Candidatus Binataceae bacterium]